MSGSLRCCLAKNILAATMIMLFKLLDFAMIFVFRRAPRKRQKVSQAARKHYLANREMARKVIKELIDELNGCYQVKIGRVAVKHHKSRWGSCSSKGNLNFNYKILFLPRELQEYIVAHELCHLLEFNHGRNFWELVAKTINDYKLRRMALKKINI
ncbi:M48 family metallopeptidase [Candidatus Falkowbacteria bacterium]|nr:M48 family metallopeptidase [Candidatus Falkowbacteria bacterium]